MRKHWQVTFDNPECKHSDKCGCKMTLTGISEKTKNLVWTGKGGSLQEQFWEAADYIEMNTTNNPASLPGTEDERWFASQLRKGASVEIIDPPVQVQHNWPQSTVTFQPAPDVMLALKRADYQYFCSRFPNQCITWAECEKWIWRNTPTTKEHVTMDYQKEVPPLWALCYRSLSMYHWVIGKTNGRQHVVAASNNLYKEKYRDALLSLSRDPIGERPAKPLELLSQAFDHFYRLMGVNLQKKENFTLSLKSLFDMYLGASAGLNHGTLTKEERLVLKEALYEIRVSLRGKKIDFVEQDINAMLEFLDSGKEPAVYWTVPPKIENFFDFSKQLNDEDYEKWLHKLRVFNIPSSIYIYMERMVSFIRHLKERGKVIRIGHKWSRGGADTLAKCLGIHPGNCWKPILVEGDAKQFDQTVRDFFVNLYWSTMGVHIDKHSEDYPAFEKICKFLLKNMVHRITQLFGQIWAKVRGGVPSGAYNTSHMDSWIMGLYFCLFMVYQLNTKVPEDQREQVEIHMFEQLMIVVYGDDHVYNKGEGEESIWFSGTQFALFMKEHFDVQIRDLKDGIPYCSVEREGWITEMGVTFLKHQFVVNPNKSEGQAFFLPYRETREYMIRAVWGRETKVRDSVDVMMSIIGHAYATYASNRNAYDRLLMLYQELLNTYETPENLQEVMEQRLGQDDIKKLRQAGITPEDLLNGFPTWEKLQEKNIVDIPYQETTLLPPDLMEPVDIDMWDVDF